MEAVTRGIRENIPIPEENVGASSVDTHVHMRLWIDGDQRIAKKTDADGGSTVEECQPQRRTHGCRKRALKFTPRGHSV